MVARTRQMARRPGNSPPWARRRRKLFIIVAGLLIVLAPALLWRVRLAVDVRARMETLRSDGRPLSLADLNDGIRPLPPGENAATVYREADRVYRDIDKAQWEALPYRGNLELALDRPIPPATLAAMEALVAANEAALALLYQAARLPDARYIEAYSLGEMDLGHLDAGDRLVTLLCCQAVLRSVHGDDPGAIEALSAARALAASLGPDGLLRSLIAQWRVEGRIMACLERLMGAVAFSAADLAPFQAQFSVERRTQRWQRMCDVERALFLERIRRGRSPGMARNILLAAGVGDLNVRAYLSLIAETRAAFGLSEEKQAPYRARHHRVVMQMSRAGMVYGTVHALMPPSHFTYMRQRADEAIVANTALAAGGYAAREGDYPEDLTGIQALESRTLSDGAPLAYRRRRGGFVLWHEGEQGGEVVRWQVSQREEGPASQGGVDESD